MKLKTNILLLLATLIASANASAQTLINLKDFPKWFQKSSAREKVITKETLLKLEQYNVDYKVKGELSLIDESEGYRYYQINIGTDLPVECHVFTTFDGPANAIHVMTEQALEGSESANKKKLSARSNFAIDTGVIGDTPYLRLDTLYSLGKGNKKVLGVVKAATAQIDDTLQLCLHSEIGYQQTFFSVFSSFIDAFLENKKQAEFFEPVYQMSFNGIPVGFTKERYSLDADGDIYIHTTSAYLLPIDGNTLSRSDSVNRSWSRPDGSLINAVTYTVENGVLASEYSISFKDDKWTVDGQLQGKPVQATLAYNGVLASGFTSYTETIRLLSSKDNKSEIAMWIPEADPTTKFDVALIKLPKNEAMNFQIDMGPITMQYLADDTGLIKDATIQQGPVGMGMKLIHSEGQPKLP